VNTTVAGNSSDGINVFIGFTNIQGCAVHENGGHGIVLKHGCKVEGCIVANNGLTGITADTFADPASGCHIRNNKVRQNFNDGIRVTSNATVEGNHCEENGSLGRAGGDGAGVHATGGNNRIDGNNVVRNDRGIDVDTVSNLIIHNSAAGNLTEYEIFAGNATGPIVGAASVATNSNPNANFDF
jgi:hypothetical protein